MITLTCPGQGSQFPGMANELLDNFPYSKLVFEEASEALKDNILKLCRDGSVEDLELTSNSQPCILTTSFAWFKVMVKELGVSPVAGAGHSLGEYTAAVCGGALSFSDAVHIVRKRGEFMQAAVPVGKGKMAAVIGMTFEKVIALCKQASTAQSIVVPANFNAPGQVVIAGNLEAVERAESMGKLPEFNARKIIPLKVSAPFHSPLMYPVREKLIPYLKAIAWKPLLFPIATNVDGVLKQKVEFTQNFVDQIDHPVLWTECVSSLAEKGCALFVEPGPGKVLAGLNKRILEGKEFRATNVDSAKGVKELETLMKE